MIIENTVFTKNGAIQGIECDNSYAWLGVPYAKPPVGELRFHAPVPMDNWSYVRETKTYPPMSIQDNEPTTTFYGKEFFSNPGFNYHKSEDCLYLNIWSPKGDLTNCPVVIWFHGGGFIRGSCSEPEFDGDAYAKRGIILVSVNSRLGLLGYICHPELRDNNGCSGNYGLLDQIEAIKWVHNNIYAFGGNPENITIWGQSSGGMSVRDLVCCPKVKTIIKHCIIQSANGYPSILPIDIPMKRMENITIRFLHSYELTIDKMRTMTTDQILKVQSDYGIYVSSVLKDIPAFFPVIDGYNLPLSPDKAIRMGITARINYLCGSLKDDVTVSDKGRINPQYSQIHNRLLNWCGKHTKGNCVSYSYYFAHNIPGENGGAFHSGELWYLFGTLNRCWRPMTEDDYRLSEKMIDAWASFIRTGNPGWKACLGKKGYYQIYE